MDTITQKLISWYQENKRDLPWRKTKNSYYIWVSEIMLQQTRVEAVISYYEKFIERFPTIESFASANIDEVLKYWEGLGYYSRVRNMYKTANILMEQKKNALPDKRDELLALPGIGAYTAGAILSIAYEMPSVAIDGNVVRIIGRYYAIDKPFLKNEKIYSSYVANILPKADADSFTQSFMDLGSSICLPKNPTCEICPLHENCLAFKKNDILKYPVKSIKKKQKIEERTVFLFICGDLIAIRKRSEKGLLASMYEFPNDLVTLSLIDLENYLLEENIAYMSVIDAGDAKHVFSHIIWLMRGFIVEVDKPFGDFLWVSKKDLQEIYSIPSAFSAFLKQFMDRK